MAYDGYLKLLPRRTGPYKIISIRPEYAMIDQNAIWNSLFINRLTEATKEKRPQMETTSDSRTSTDRNPGNKVSTQKNIYAAEKIVGLENRPTRTYNTVPQYGFRTQQDAVKPTASIPHHFRDAYW